MEAAIDAGIAKTTSVLLKHREGEGRLQMPLCAMAVAVYSRCILLTAFYGTEVGVKCCEAL